MMPEPSSDFPAWDRIKELFSATYEVDSTERHRILDAAASDDVALRQRVETLLAAHDRESGVLDRPAIAALEGSAVLGLGPAEPMVGRRLGPYQVVREIARGGMGAVYEGLRRDEQFAQRVAIKTLLVGSPSNAVLRRFRQERQILAGLQHPNIAVLYDGGLTDDGLPYIVLEYVDGVPIDVYCTEQRLGLRARLDLFRQVVAAVQYAHRQLVIHRDLKPANILVTPDRVVKLLDFGIAKLVQPDEQDLTGEALAPLTLGYASPEQVAGDTITTATDVYSLGGVLYRLLSGSNPLDVDSLSLERAVTTIRHVLPLPPSTTAQPGVAEAMGLESAERLRRTLRGDLDAIVLTALRKEPDRRYLTAQAMGDDLQRYLRGLPVNAVADSVGYRVKKFVRRRRSLVAGMLLGAIALLLGVGIALWQARSARREAAKATRISEFVQGLLAGNVNSLGTTRRLPQANLTLQEVLDTAAHHLPVDLADEPLVRAALHRVLGRGYLAAMRGPPAREQFDSALAIHRRERGARDTSLAADLLGLGEVLGLTRPDSAELMARDALRILASNRVPDTAAVQLAAVHQLATWLSFQGKLASAESSFVSFITAERSRVQPRHQAVGLALGALGLVQHNLGRMESAELNMREGIEVLGTAGGDPSVELASRLYTFGTHLASKGKAEEAAGVLRRARDMATLTAPPSNSLHLQVRMALADALSQSGDTAAAHAEARAALALVPGLAPGSELYVLTAEYAYARMLRREQLWPEAEAAARQQYATGIRVAGSVPYYLADVHNLLGGVLSDRGRFAEAEQRLLEAYRISREKLGPTNFRTIRSARELALLYLRSDRLVEAERYLLLLTPVVADSVRAAARRP